MSCVGLGEVKSQQTLSTDGEDKAEFAAPLLMGLGTFSLFFGGGDAKLLAKMGRNRPQNETPRWVFCGLRVASPLLLPIKRIKGRKLETRPPPRLVWGN